MSVTAVKNVCLDSSWLALK